MRPYDLLLGKDNISYSYMQSDRVIMPCDNQLMSLYIVWGPLFLLPGSSSEWLGCRERPCLGGQILRRGVLSG